MVAATSFFWIFALHPGQVFDVWATKAAEADSSAANRANFFLASSQVYVGVPVSLASDAVAVLAGTACEDRGSVALVMDLSRGTSGIGTPLEVGKIGEGDLS